MKANVDFLIVGQGLAGTLLSYELIIRNKSFIVFDAPEKPKASEVAAGLINPVVFRRMTKSWMVDEAFPQMEQTYRGLELLLQTEFYHPSLLLKILDEDSIAFWKEKAVANQLTPYLTPECCQNQPIGNLNKIYSFGAVNKSGRIDLLKLISRFSDYLNSHELLQHRPFKYQEIHFAAGSVHYNNFHAQKIIFCEGAAASANPFFNPLRFKHSKGEVLELTIPQMNLNQILSKEIFLMPVGKDNYKVGATYSWDDLNWKTTELARKELIGKLKAVTDLPFKITGHKAGIRPTMHDRKPVIGLLPHQPEIGIFNGLGSKGALLGPYFAQKFVDYLTGTSDNIPPEANISRYFKTK